MSHYLVRAVSDIRRGSASIEPGWAMGPFYSTKELAFTSDFEVKEWDSTLVRKQWAGQAAHGSEYITVTCGTLTVIGGERSADGTTTEIADRIVVDQGSS